MLLLKRLLPVFYVSVCVAANAAPPIDTLKYREIFSQTLKGDFVQVLQMLDTIRLARPEDILFKKEFEQRFKYAEDSTDFLAGVPAGMQPLYRIFQQYWRKSLLDRKNNYDTVLQRHLIELFRTENEKSKFTDSVINDKTLEHLFTAYIKSKGFSAADYGKTGFLYDLIVWETMTDTVYSITLIDDTVNVKVNFIDDFISLGWLVYARMGRTSPGGWATKKELYCVAKGYDTSAEKFQVSYLKHEGQHFSDYQRYGELPPADLEYRAKLLELYFARNSMSALLESFINGARYDSTNSHPFANYCVIRDMSQLIFTMEFEKNVVRWKTIQPARIKAAAKTLFLRHNTQLQKGHRLR